MLDATLQTIEATLAAGDEVTITGFGKFSVADRAARQGINPATGEPIAIAASRAPRFSAGAKLKHAVERAGARTASFYSRALAPARSASAIGAMSSRLPSATRMTSA